MEATKHDSKNLFRGFLIGSLVGAAAGMVFAPKPGRELRSDIKGKGEKVIEDTKQFYSDFRAKADNMLESAKDVFGGGERSEGILFRDLEEPDEFTAEAYTEENRQGFFKDTDVSSGSPSGLKWQQE